MAKSPLSVRRPSTLSAYKPSLREQAAILGEKGFKALTGREPGYEARENINRYTGLLDLLEVPGAVLSANEAARNIKSKQYGAAAGDIAGLAAGAIPIAGGALKKGAKKVVEEAVKDASKLAANFQPSLQSAIRHNGKIYIGKNHRDALAKIPTKEEQNKIDLFDDRHVGFADDKGKFLGRYDAMQYAQDFNLLRPEIKTKAGPLLVSEMLKQRPALEPTTENLVTKYDLPPVITGAEREANLARFMEGSQAPRDLYHGTGADFEEPKGIFWGSENPSLANEYAAMREVMGGNANVVPVHMNVGSAFDADNLPKDVTINHFFNEALQQAQNTGKNVDVEKAKSLLKTIRENAKIEESGPHYSRHEFWNQPEYSFGKQGAAAIRDMMDTLGFDSIKMLENNTKTYGVFDPKRIKSKFNIGTFDPTVPHIGKAHGGPVSLKDKYGC